MSSNKANAVGSAAGAAGGASAAGSVSGIPQTGEKKAFESTDASTSVLFDILNLEEIDTHLFRGYSPRVPRWGRIYGGQTVGQALVAAGRTTDSHFVVHSLHCNFLRPGNDDIPVLYQVDSTRDGQTFCTRRVRAIQKGKDIFIASVSFKLLEKPPQYTHSEAMPHVPDPSTLPSVWEPYRKRHEKSGVDEFPFPVDIKRISPLPDAKGWMPRDAGAQQRSWVRVNGRLPDNPLMHQCAMAYLSDWGLMSTSLLPHGYNIKGNRHVQMASLDHVIWFHTPFRADEWLLHDTYSPRASNGTSLNFGRFFTRDGVHCVSTAQEGLIRLIASQPPELPLSAAGSAATSIAGSSAAGMAPKKAGDASAKPKEPKGKAAAGAGAGDKKAADGDASKSIHFATPARFFDTIRKDGDAKDSGATVTATTTSAKAESKPSLASATTAATVATLTPASTNGGAGFVRPPTPSYTAGLAFPIPSRL